MYSKESLELLRDKIDLVELLSSHIELKRAGASHKALCPFHEEKTPSFVVQAGDSHYHCFGCGAHGDAIAFLMGFLKLSFAEAVESLAERFGVTLETVDKPSGPRGPSKRELYDVMEKARDFYHFYLLHTDEGHAALKYLFDRGLDLNFVRLFKIGLAPKPHGLFQKAMATPPALMQLVGLQKEQRDFFYDRITFPILDAVGHVIGFSARKCSEETFGPKYVNTPETPLFKKSKTLFGLFESRRRIAKERRAIVVEGQIDALRLIEEGFNLTVAGQGTAFGADHAKELITLGVTKVFLALDGDKAGAEAAVKIGDLFQREGVEVAVALMPPGGDPDTLLREEGPEAFQKELDQAQDYLSFLVKFYAGEGALSPAKKSQIVTRISEQIRKWDHPLMVHESLRKLAELTEVPESVIGVQEVQRQEVFIKKSGSVNQQTGINPDRILEADLLRWLLLVGESNEKIVKLAKDNLEEKHFRIPSCRRIFSVASASPSDLLTIASKLDSVEDQLFLSEILQKKVNMERAEEGMREVVEKILQRHWMERREDIKQQIQSGRCNEAELFELAKEFDAIKAAPPQVSYD